MPKGTPESPRQADLNQARKKGSEGSARKSGGKGIPHLTAHHRSSTPFAAQAAANDLPSAAPSGGTVSGGASDATASNKVFMEAVEIWSASHQEKEGDTPSKDFNAVAAEVSKYAPLTSGVGARAQPVTLLMDFDTVAAEVSRYVHQDAKIAELRG